MIQPISSDFDNLIYPRKIENLSNFDKYGLLYVALKGNAEWRDEALKILAHRYPDEYAPDKDE